MSGSDTPAAAQDKSLLSLPVCRIQILLPMYQAMEADIDREEALKASALNELLLAAVYMSDSCSGSELIEASYEAYLSNESFPCYGTQEILGGISNATHQVGNNIADAIAAELSRLGSRLPFPSERDIPSNAAQHIS